MLRGHAEEGVGMRKVLDWKFFLRVAVAVTALTLFLSAALAADGAETVRVYDETRRAEVKLREAQLAFLRSFIREHSSDLDKYIKGEKKIETTIKIGTTEYSFSIHLTDLIAVSPGTSLEDFMKLIDKAIDTLRAENKDHLTASESRVTVPEPASVREIPAGTTVEGTSHDASLIQSLIGCIKEIKAEYNESIKMLTATIALLKAELDKSKKEGESKITELMQHLGFKDQMIEIKEFISEFSKLVGKYREFKAAQQSGDWQRVNQLSGDIQQLIADIYPQLEQKKSSLSYQLQMGRVQFAQLNEEFNKKETSDERKEAIKKEVEVLKGQMNIAGGSLNHILPIDNKLREIAYEIQTTQSVRQQNLMPVQPELAEALRQIVGGGQFQGQGIVRAVQPVGQQGPRSQTFAGFLRTRENPYVSGGQVQTPQPIATTLPSDGFVSNPFPRGTFEGDMIDGRGFNPTPWRNPLVEQQQQIMQYMMQQQMRQSQSVQQDIFSGRLNFI